MSATAEDLRAINERLIVSGVRELEVLEASQREKAQLSALFATLKEGVLIVDGSGSVVMMNDAARGILRIDVGVEHAQLQQVLAALDIRSVEKTFLVPEEHPFRRAMVGEAFADVDVLLVRADGEAHRLTISAACTMDGNGVALAILLFRDLTERVRLEEQLAHTERLAIIGTLSAGMAHEINNPLATTVANVEFAIKVIAGTLRRLGAIGGAEISAVAAQLVDVNVALGEARDASLRIGGIVSEVKSFARRQAVEQTTLDLGTVIDSAIRATESTIGHLATVQRDYQQTPLVEAHEPQLTRVVINLLTNAAQAIGEGASATKEIVVATFTDATGQAVIEIRDTGPGIPPDIQRRIFDPFFTTKPVGKGSGLGLSICLSIVNSSHGKISVSSKVGKGATFRITLPPSVKERRSAKVPVAPRVAKSARGRVLIVDDDVTVGRAVARVIRYDHDAVAFSDPVQALTSIAVDAAFDVILCDLMMPKMNGIQFYEAVRSTYPQLAKRIVFITGGACTVEAEEFLRVTTNATLTKPVEADVLLKLIAGYVGRSVDVQ